MTGLKNSHFGAAAFGAALALAAGTGSALAGDGFSGDVSVSYNSHFVSYGVDVWHGGSTLFKGNVSPTFVNGDLYYTAGALTLTGNVWFDILGEKGGGTNGLGGSIQEVDLNLGAAYAIGPVTLSATYGRWNYPGGPGLKGDAEGIVDLAASFNDADMLIKGFAINPKITAHIRVDKGAGQVDTGTAIVLAIGPSVALGPVALSFPAGAVFFTTKDFQGGTDDGYAYSYAGISASYPLSFIPTKYGTWSVFTDWIGYFTEAKAIPSNPKKDFLTADVGIKLAF
jgi:hypothetical protein